MRRPVGIGRLRRIAVVPSWPLVLLVVVAAAAGQDRGAPVAPVVPVAPVAPEPTAPAVPYGVAFTGNRAFGATRLEAQVARELAGFQQSGGAPSYLEDAAYALARFYRTEGYVRVAVSYRVEAAPRPVVVFTVHEGSQVWVRSVDVTGAARFEPDELLERARVRGLAAGRRFDRRLVEADLERIRGVYRLDGFPDARVELGLVETAADSGVAVQIRIQEGPRIFLREVVLDGVEPERARAVQESLAPILTPHRPFHRALAEEVRAVVLDHYGNRGFPLARAEVDWSLDRGAGAAVLALRIQEGPRARFGRLRLEGNAVTRDAVVRSRVRFRPGMPFDQEALWKSEVDLYDTTLFRKVTFEPGTFHPDPDDPSTGTLDHVLRLEEHDPIQIDAFLGYGSYERVRGGVAVRDINLFGTGRTVEGVFQASLKNLRAELNFSDGLTLGRGITLALRNAYERRAFPSFDRLELGSVLEAGLPLADVLEARIGYRYIRSDARRVEDPVEADRQGSVSLSGPSLGFTFDTRDNPVDPEAGVLLAAAYELASSGLGGEIDFHRVVGTARAYVSLAKEWVLAGSIRGGIIAPFGETADIPIQERFFNGGATSVRSFQQFELGPRSDTGELEGGQAYVTLNAEFRFPIYRLLHGAVFADAGNVKRGYRDFDLQDLRYGLGGGLYLTTPVGPIRVDAAANPNPRDDEDAWALHVSVGYAF